MKFYFIQTIRVLNFFIVLLLVLFTQNSIAKGFHSLDDIKETAREFVLNRINNTDEDIQVVIGRLDQRLRLNQCSVPLEAYSPDYEVRRGGLSTVGVRCNDVKPWSLYVPVSVKNFKKIAVLKHAVVRNTLLTEEDISFQKTNINQLTSGYFENIKDLKDKVLSQNLSKGTILTRHMVKSPMAIKRGQVVTLIAKNAVIEVRMEGKAMSKGAIGERIKVKNLKTNRIVEGVVMDKHLINVNL